MWSFGSDNSHKKMTLPSGRVILPGAMGKIYYRKSDPGFMLKYSTYLDIEDTVSLQQEINEIWSLFKRQADESGLNSAVISANSPPPTKVFSIGTQKTRNFAFIKNKNGIWQSANSQTDETEVEDYQVIFGAVETKNDLSLVYRDLTSLPLVTREENFYYGFTILPADNEPFNYHCHFYPPKIAQFTIETGEIVEEINDSNDSISGFRLPTRRTQGITTAPMWFDAGDPPGEYRIEIYINDRLTRAVDFSVYEPQQ